MTGRRHHVVVIEAVYIARSPSKRVRQTHGRHAPEQRRQNITAPVNSAPPNYTQKINPPRSPLSAAAAGGKRYITSNVPHYPRLDKKKHHQQPKRVQCAKTKRRTRHNNKKSKKRQKVNAAAVTRTDAQALGDRSTGGNAATQIVKKSTSGNNIFPP